VPATLLAEDETLAVSPPNPARSADVSIAWEELGLLNTDSY
jgi:hypothetical protein